MRRASTLGIDYLVVRLLAHKIRWGSYHELMHEWTLLDVVAANRASDIADRLEVLNAPKSP